MKLSFPSVLTWAVLCMIGTAIPAAAVSVERAQPGKTHDANRLEGRWVRPDGGYVLELRDIKKDGSLKAAYFNPRPVNVHQATWESRAGVITVFVELRDINYPGSKYDLQYDPKSDRLKGAYFQAVEKQTYAIEFVRSK